MNQNPGLLVDWGRRLKMLERGFSKSLFFYGRSNHNLLKNITIPRIFLVECRGNVAYDGVKSPAANQYYVIPAGKYLAFQEILMA